MGPHRWLQHVSSVLVESRHALKLTVKLVWTITTPMEPTMCEFHQFGSKPDQYPSIILRLTPKSIGFITAIYGSSSPKLWYTFRWNDRKYLFYGVL